MCVYEMIIRQCRHDRNNIEKNHTFTNTHTQSERERNKEADRINPLSLIHQLTVELINLIQKILCHIFKKQSFFTDRMFVTEIDTTYCLTASIVYFN